MIWPEIKAEIMSIRDAAGYEQGKQMASEFIEKYKKNWVSGKDFKINKINKN